MIFISTICESNKGLLPSLRNALKNKASYFETITGIIGSCKDGRERFHVPFTLFPPVVTSYITTAQCQVQDLDSEILCASFIIHHMCRFV